MIIRLEENCSTSLCYISLFSGPKKSSWATNYFPSDVLDHRELAMAEPAMENGEAPRKKVRRGDPQFNQLRTRKRQKENPEVKSSQSSALLLFCCPTGVTLLGLS